MASKLATLIVDKILADLQGRENIDYMCPIERIDEVEQEIRTAWERIVDNVVEELG